MNRYISLFLLTLALLPSFAQKWSVEAEDEKSSVKWQNGVADIHATKGLTLWCKDLMEGNTVIEYEAQICGDGRVSDLNCFWMSDKAGGYGGKFVNNYAHTLYYLGYGGNGNTTTRFRRYTGAFEDGKPIILKEYTDAQHLLKPNHWYNIRVECIDGHARYYIDGECLVDYVDPQPLTKGYFGFRTTESHAQMRNFHYSCTDPGKDGVVLKWVGGKGGGPVTFGVPFSRGEVTKPQFILKTDKGDVLPTDTWTLAKWADGSIKWQAFCAVVPEGVEECRIEKAEGRIRASKDSSSDRSPKTTYQKNCPRVPEGGVPSFSVTLNNRPQPILSTEIEHEGNIRKVTKYTGRNFIIRAYQYKGSDQIKFVHTLLVDSALNADGLSELSLHFPVQMHGPCYERFVKFDDYNMSVEPLIARRKIDMQKMDSTTRLMLANIAKWDEFRLTQLSANGYSIRKRATSQSCWIGTKEGTRSRGEVTVGDSTSRMTFCLKDFWQSYPASLQVNNAREEVAEVVISLYAPQTEPYSFAPYDTVAHHLLAAYEDVQPGMSTAFGMARTSEIFITTGRPYHDSQFVCTPEYYHRKRAFGIWSLPTVENERDSIIEATLSDLKTFYLREIERNSWYGFWNYGDVMHGYDSSREEWRYDVGGYAWDNTELGSPSMMWYHFLRTGDPDWWRMATAMTRHCSEVDVYHDGPHKGLGSRHNVVHWGCGAKESRISEAWWNRFMYYLTADERLGDLMHAVVDADTLLYHLDPMRLAQPRGEYPCTAPARLRIGPDWLGYASNWFTEYERNGSKHHLQKLFTGMKSIGDFKEGFFQGPLALGYYPETGVITSECDSALSTNHLMAIMGGFELMNEMEEYFDNTPQTQLFFQKWADHCLRYKHMAKVITHNSFLVPRLSAYAGWRLGNKEKLDEAWKDVLTHKPYLPGITKPEIPGWSGSVTNDNATWTLDAVFLKEVGRD